MSVLPRVQPWHWRLRQYLAEKSDSFYEEAAALAAKAAKLKKSQIAKLQGIAYGAVKIADLIDFVKIQTGRQDEWRKTNFGPDLLEVIRRLGDEAAQALPVLGVPEEERRTVRTQLHLALCREYIKHLAAHYLYGREEAEQ